MSWRLSSALFIAALLSVGCAKKEGTEEGQTAAADAPIGVAECDEYVKKMDVFLDGLPEDAKAAREPGFKAMRAAWRDTAQTPAGKEGLAATCKAQLATLGDAKK